MRYFLAEDAVLRRLETPSVYHLKKDELYDLDEEAFAFLVACGSAAGCAGPDGEFVDFCLSEGILTVRNTGVGRLPLAQAPVPSLRYLELQITDRCNLRCGHCYLGDGQGNHELSFNRIRNILEEFDRMQGLRVLLTGGEPLLHRDFVRVNEMLPEFRLRKVLFTNGVLVREETVRGLHVDEIQVSIDGLKAGHDALRGEGTFEAVMNAVKICLDAGFDVSVSTMVHAKNLGEFDEMEGLFREMGVKDWTVDIPCAEGRLKHNTGFQVTPGEAGAFLGYGFGGGIHASSSGFGCGLHLMAVSAGGRVSKCTFYADRPAGRIEEGLAECWRRITPVRLQDLSCDCAHLDECRGGCRYRAELAGDASGRDLFRCHYYGIMDTELA